MDINMNTNNGKSVGFSSVNTAIADALLKLKKEPQKDGVDLTEIAKKLSDKKFGKDRRSK